MDTKLIKLNNGEWMATGGEVFVRGTLNDVKEALEGAPFRVKCAEVDLAVNVMRANGHNCAEFSSAGMFVYSEGSGRGSLCA